MKSKPPLNKVKYIRKCKECPLCVKSMAINSRTAFPYCIPGKRYLTDLKGREFFCPMDKKIFYWPSII